VVNRRRWNSFQDSAEALGLEATRIGPFSPRQGSGAVSADEMLASGATATVAFNDILAIEMLQRFAELGVRVPDDVSIVGCDDIVGSAFCYPPLTTISAPALRVGRELTSLLLAAINGTDDALATDTEVPSTSRSAARLAQPRDPSEVRHPRTSPGRACLTAPEDRYLGGVQFRVCTRPRSRPRRSTAQRRSPGGSSTSIRSSALRCDRASLGRRKPLSTYRRGSPR
jgi:hypothetical protein